MAFVSSSASQTRKFIADPRKSNLAFLCTPGGISVGYLRLLVDNFKRKLTYNRFENVDCMCAIAAFSIQWKRFS